MIVKHCSHSTQAWWNYAAGRVTMTLFLHCTSWDSNRSISAYHVFQQLPHPINSSQPFPNIGIAPQLHVSLSHPHLLSWQLLSQIGACYRCLCPKYLHLHQSGILLGARIVQLVKNLDLQSLDRRFEPHCQRGVFLVLAFSRPLTPNC